jgi:hypothetical protein
MTGYLVTLLIGVSLGIALRAIHAQGAQINQCAACPHIADLTSRVQDCAEAVDDPVPATQPPLAPLRTVTIPCAIDLDRLAQAESRNDPAAISRAGARGPYQFMEATFKFVVAQMGRQADWQWPEDAHDPGISRAVAHRYINKEIPQQLHAGGVPDSKIARLAAYNWGAANVARVWRQPGGLAGNMPDETRALIRRYVGASRTKKQ